MRYVTLAMRPTDGEAFHPVGARLAADDAVRREAIHRMDVLGDGTLCLLAEASGDLDRYREILGSSPSVREFTVAGDGSGYAYSLIEPNDLSALLVERGRENDFVREWPIEVLPDGGYRVTLIGSEEAFRAATHDPPDGVAFEIERTGEYRPDAGRLVDVLTGRQREIVEAAVAAGYYDQPRRASHEDLAAELDCSPATVGEHLQKAERAVFRALVG